MEVGGKERWLDGLISHVRSSSGGAGLLQICLGGKVGSDNKSQFFSF